MKHSTITLALLMSIACAMLLSLSIQAQAPIVHADDLISSHTEEIHIYNFVYSPISKAYELTCNSTRPLIEEEGQLAVFMAFDDSEEFIYLPDNEDDLRSIRNGSNEITYEIDPMGMIKVVIQNKNGGTPWSTMDIDRIHLKQYFLASNVSPLHEQEVDLEDEELLSSLTEKYVQEQLTNR